MPRADSIEILLVQVRKRLAAQKAKAKKSGAAAAALAEAQARAKKGKGKGKDQAHYNQVCHRRLCPSCCPALLLATCLRLAKLHHMTSVELHLVACPPATACESSSAWSCSTAPYCDIQTLSWTLHCELSILTIAACISGHNGSLFCLSHDLCSACLFPTCSQPFRFWLQLLC